MGQIWIPCKTFDKSTFKVIQNNDDSEISSSIDIEKHDTKSELELEESVRKIRETNKNACIIYQEAKKKQIQDLDLELELLSKRNNMLHDTLLHKEEEVSKFKQRVIDIIQKGKGSNAFCLTHNTLKKSENITVIRSSPDPMDITTKANKFKNLISGPGNLIQF